LRAETGVLQGKPVLRGFRGDGTVLRLRHIWVRNSFQTFAFLRLSPGGHGTHVQVTLRSRYDAAAILAIWLGIAIVISILSLTQVISGAGNAQDLWFALLFPFFGVVVIVFGRLLARPERAALLDFIRQTIDARDVPPELVPSC